MLTDYINYKYDGLTPNEEGDVIGFVLIDPKEKYKDICVHICLNSGPLKDIAAIKGYKHEMYISPLYYSQHGNYLGYKKEYFTPAILYRSLP